MTSKTVRRIQSIVQHIHPTKQQQQSSNNLMISHVSVKRIHLHMDDRNVFGIGPWYMDADGDIAMEFFYATSDGGFTRCTLELRM